MQHWFKRNIMADFYQQHTSEISDLIVFDSEKAPPWAAECMINGKGVEFSMGTGVGISMGTGVGIMQNGNWYGTKWCRGEPSQELAV